MKRFLVVFSGLFLLASTGLVFAGSLGDLANGIREPIAAFSGAFNLICYVLGSAFLVGTLIRYVEYRRNPVQVRLSQVFFLLILGLLLIVLPYLSSFSVSVKTVGQQHRLVPTAGMQQ